MSIQSRTATLFERAMPHLPNGLFSLPGIPGGEYRAQMVRDHYEGLTVVRGAVTELGNPAITEVFPGDYRLLGALGCGVHDMLGAADGEGSAATRWGETERRLRMAQLSVFGSLILTELDQLVGSREPLQPHQRDANLFDPNAYDQERVEALYTNTWDAWLSGATHEPLPDFDATRQRGVHQLAQYMHFSMGLDRHARDTAAGSKRRDALNDEVFEILTEAAKTRVTKELTGNAEADLGLRLDAAYDLGVAAMCMYGIMTEQVGGKPVDLETLRSIEHFGGGGTILAEWSAAVRHVTEGRHTFATQKVGGKPVTRSTVTDLATLAQKEASGQFHEAQSGLNPEQQDIGALLQWLMSLKFAFDRLGVSQSPVGSRVSVRNLRRAQAVRQERWPQGAV